MIKTNPTNSLSPIWTGSSSHPIQKIFSTADCFDALHVKNVQHRNNVRGLVNQRYNELLNIKQLTAFQIPGGNSPEKLGMDKATSILRPDLYYQAFNEVLWRFNDRSDFPWPLSTGTFFDLLHNENIKYSANARGLINQRYNQLLNANQCHNILIEGSHIDALGLNKTSPIQRADLYFQAYNHILQSFEINDFILNRNEKIISDDFVIYAFDVGGTKIAYSIASRFEVFAKGEINTPKGPCFLVEAIKNVFKSVDISNREGVISIATPGNIKNGVILGSSSLLEAHDNTGNLKHEFDNLNLQKAIAQVIPNTRILHSNDATAQFVGAVDSLNTDGSLNGKLVAYLGIGSGFGGGLGRIDRSGNLYCYTDGNVWDMRLNVDGVEMPAHSLLGGFPFKQTTGVTPKEVNENTGLLSKHTPHIEKIGRALAATAIAIHQGKVKKMDSCNDWNEVELNQIRGTSHFLIGGSIGTKGEISKIILEAARKEIRKANLEQVITFLQIPDAADSATRGCQVLMKEALKITNG